MDFDPESLGQAAADIWSSMLGIDLAPGNGSMGKLHDERTLTGIVQITGDWAGAVTIQCTGHLASHFASVMFDCAADTLGLDEVRDALGELTNMTGGTVKGMMPGSCQLGIPAVAEGHDYTLTIPKGSAVCTIGFEYEGDPLEIVVYQTV